MFGVPETGLLKCALRRPEQEGGKERKDSERYSPESGHIRKRYGDLERVPSGAIVQTEELVDTLQSSPLNLKLPEK